MKGWILLTVGLLAAGCDYRVPMTSKPRLPIDKAVVGVWEAAGEEEGVEQARKKERLLVLPLDEREYLVFYPMDAEGGMFAKACLCRCGDKTLVQLKWFGTVEGNTPDDDRLYQYCAYDVSNATLTVRTLNTSVVSRDIESPSRLVKAVKTALDEPKVFDDPVVFKRVEIR